MGGKDGYLAFELEDRAMDEGFIEEESGIICAEARGEIIGAVEDEVVVFDDIETVIGVEIARMLHDFDMRVHRGDARTGAFQLGCSHPVAIVEDLAMEI